ncbi:YwmB family TATA-box binding protein [Alkalicella caledoniensis]|uniref:YwmB family TATA-box binding protein n=1 Tax=Alkalicella caledoniensis TaxID=2731377 RepID=A0A7G9W915_ALKCA|nr:YwmB family TATA-box binding protein [Alkalicella caledoniensis]QNO15177.1 YwmB family TATA-box binding protein [Alkalicella caledoniensis]
MRKKYLLLSILLVLLLSISTALISVEQSRHNIQDETGLLLYGANSMDGDILGYSINGYLAIEGENNKEDMAMYMKEIVSNLGLDTFDFDNVYINDQEDNEYASMDWYYQKNYYKTILNLNDSKLYISIAVDLAKDAKVNEIYDRVSKELTKIEHTLDVESSLVINTAIYKELPGELTRNEVIEQIYLGFKNMGAKLVSDYSNEGGSMGFIGYSPLLKNTVNMNDKKYNLHMAVYYDETIEQYYLTIANPVIESSY